MNNPKAPSRRHPPRTRTTLALAVVAALCAGSAFAAPALTVAHPTRLQAGDAVLGALPMSQAMHVSVALKMRDQAGLDAYVAQAAANQKKGVFAPAMSSEQFLASHAPSAAQAQAVVDYLARKGFTNIHIAPNRMSVSADGTARSASDAFMTTFAQVRTHDNRTAWANTSEAMVPAELADKVRGVMGLETVHVAHTFAHRLPGGSSPMLTSTAHFPDLFPAIYGVGSAAAATNQFVGVVTQGTITQTLTDLAAYTKARSQPTTTVETVAVGGPCMPTTAAACTANIPQWDLDTQTIVGMSGGVSKLILYNIPNFTEGSLYDDVSEIVSGNHAKIVDFSVAQCELEFKGEFANVMDDQFEIAAAQGQTFAVMTGDTGADECGDGGITPSWPAASQYVIAVAGTRLSDASGGGWGSEVEWSGSGGSPSTFEPQPPWQKTFIPTTNPTTNRAVADLAYDADPATGASIYVNGKVTSLGGTELATSIFAGAWARMLEKYPTIGFAGPVLYALPATDFHDITVGNNTGEAASTGFDYASGRGSLIVGTAITDAATLGDQPPKANFSWVANGQTVNFTDTSTVTVVDGDSGIVAHNWKFGDGATSTDANPTHTYATGGTFKVNEQVQDTVGHYANITQSVNLGAGPVQLLNNTSFETQSPLSWSMSTGVETNNPSLAHTGSWFANIGGAAGTEHVWQKVALPTGKTTATLAFYLHTVTAETGTAANDVLSVEVTDTSGNVLGTLATYSNLNPTSGYVQESLDMSKYIGQTVRVFFSGTNNATLPTNWYVDDVTLNVQ